MAKKYTQAELIALMGDGASVSMEKEPQQPVEISQMARLLSEITRIANANEDIAKKQYTNIEKLLDRLTKIMLKDKIDMTPIATILAEIQLNTTHVRQGFVFHVNRDQRNLIKTVEAVPTDRIIN